jgi:hypothetical protein
MDHVYDEEVDQCSRALRHLRVRHSIAAIEFRNEHIFKHLVQSSPSRANRQLTQPRH